MTTEDTITNNFIFNHPSDGLEYLVEYLNDNLVGITSPTGIVNVSMYNKKYLEMQML